MENNKIVSYEIAEKLCKKYPQPDLIDGQYWYRKRDKGMIKICHVENSNLWAYDASTGQPLVEILKNNISSDFIFAPSKLELFIKIMGMQINKNLKSSHPLLPDEDIEDIDDADEYANLWLAGND